MPHFAEVNQSVVPMGKNQCKHRLHYLRKIAFLMPFSNVCISQDSVETSNGFKMLEVLYTFFCKFHPLSSSE